MSHLGMLLLRLGVPHTECRLWLQELAAHLVATQVSMLLLLLLEEPLR
jgi:hypothetical protein